MAYKFQLGAAKLSGSIEQTDGSSITAQSNFVIGSADINETDLEKIDGITNGTAAANKALVLDGSSDISGINNIGAAQLSGSGNLLIGGGGMIAGDLDVAGALTGSGISLSDASGIAGDGIVNNSGVLDLDVANLGTSLTGDLQDADLIAVDDNSGGGTKKAQFSVVRDAVYNDVSGDATVAAGGALTLANDAVSGSNIADGGIANAKLVNSDVTIGSTAVALGATQTSFSGLTGLDFTAASAAIASSIGANNLTLGGSTSTVIVAGNLTVQGTTTTVDSTTINISSSFTFEGLADDYETTLNIVDPSADRTVSLPNASGVVPVLSPSLSDSELATVITAKPAEINLLDAGAGSSVSLADGDGIIIFDVDDSEANSAKKVLMSDIKSYVAGAALSVVSKADGNNLEADKVNYFADLSADATVTLPASAASLVGKSIYIKAADLTSGATIIINTQASAQKIDGQDSIILESPYAAVRLVYVATNDWRVF